MATFVSSERSPKRSPTKSATAIAALLAATLLAPRGARGLDVDALLKERPSPELEYRSARTEHFELHYPAILEELATHVAGAAARAHVKTTKTLGLAPEGRTHLVLSARSDQTQVFTVVYPHRLIYLDATPPNWAIGINDYPALHEWLLTHEYVHALQLDLRRGPFAPLSSLFGAWMRPGLAMPAWFKEGLAVHCETRLSRRGRGGSSTYRMVLRQARFDGVLREDWFLAPDTAATFDNKAWPWVLRPYLFGYELVSTLLDDRPHRAGAILA